MAQNSRLPKNLKIEGSINTKGLLFIKVKSIHEGEILNRFSKAINKATARVAIDLKTELDQAIRNPGWSWINGQRDIYDTGQLMDSGTVSIGKNGVTIAYSAPYAALVHYGGYINPYGSGREAIYLPPRPWVDSVLNGGGLVPIFDFAKYYKEEIEAEFT
jgi:phage gpG-like protein